MERGRRGGEGGRLRGYTHLFFTSTLCCTAGLGGEGGGGGGGEVLPRQIFVAGPVAVAAPGAGDSGVVERWKEGSYYSGFLCVVVVPPVRVPLSRDEPDTTTKIGRPARDRPIHQVLNLPPSLGRASYGRTDGGWKIHFTCFLRINQEVGSNQIPFQDRGKGSARETVMNKERSRRATLMFLLQHSFSTFRILGWNRRYVVFLSPFFHAVGPSSSFGSRRMIARISSHT